MRGYGKCKNSEGLAGPSGMCTHKKSRSFGRGRRHAPLLRVLGQRLRQDDASWGRTHDLCTNKTAGPSLRSFNYPQVRLGQKSAGQKSRADSIVPPGLDPSFVRTQDSGIRRQTPAPNTSILGYFPVVPTALALSAHIQPSHSQARSAHQELGGGVLTFRRLVGN